MKQYDEYELKLIEWLKTFKNRKELTRYSNKVYLGLMCKYRYILDEALPVTKWSLEKCKIDALKYKTRKDWLKGSSSAYHKAMSKGWLEECCSHMERLRDSNTQEKMILNMPKGVSFVKNQSWKGLDKTYKFFCEKFGEFESSPVNLMRQSWNKGYSGHPKGRPTRKKSIKCLENNRIFLSINSAAKELALNHGCINEVLSGKRKSTGGYTFVYVEEENEN